MNKIWTLVLRSFKDRRTSLIIFSIVSIAFLWMYVALFPSFKDQMKQLEELLQAYPKSLMEAFNIDISAYSQIEGFVSSEHFSLIWPIFVIILATATGGGAIAGEIEKGTIEFLLAQPISRLKLFLAKYFAGLIGLIIFVALTIFAIFPIAAIHGIDIKAENFVTFSWIAFLFGWAVFSLAMFFTTLFNSKGKVYFLTAGIIVLMYVAKIVSGLKDNLDKIKYSSFFYYFDSSKLLVHREVDNWAYVIFFGVIIIFTFLGAYIFTKRDVAV
jgi:ABC-2 type transport system permease protein